MKIRYALALAALLPITAACKMTTAAPTPPRRRPNRLQLRRPPNRPLRPRAAKAPLRRPPKAKGPGRSRPAAAPAPTTAVLTGPAPVEGADYR